MITICTLGLTSPEKKAHTRTNLGVCVIAICQSWQGRMVYMLILQVYESVDEHSRTDIRDAIKLGVICCVLLAIALAQFK